MIQSLGDGGISFIIADLSAERLLAGQGSKAAGARGILLFNVSATDERLREGDCKGNIVHVAPTRSMLADALAQYLVWKQWRRWLLIKGSHPEDELLAQAYRNSARKFGAKIVEERVYEDTGGGRRSDSGSVQTQRQIPILTQSAPAHDVIVAADKSEVFAAYLPYHNLDPRPVVVPPASFPKCGMRPTSNGAPDSTAKPIRQRLSSLHECARSRRLAGGAHDRRSDDADGSRRPSEAARVFALTRFFHRRFQRGPLEPALVQSAVATAHLALRR